MSLLYFLLATYILLSISLYSVFKKANISPHKAFLPGINFIAWCQLIGRPKWWAALLLLPIVNIFIFAGMSVDLVRSFKKYSFWDSVLAVVYAPLAFFKIGYTEKDQYDGPTLIKEKRHHDRLFELYEQGASDQYRMFKEASPYYKSPSREWTEAIVFSVFAAAFIRMFTIEAYAIPTSSMEGSLIVGDHLFVSKLHYGLRTPETIAMVPLLHNRLPFFEKESYFKTPRLTPYRLPGIEQLSHNMPVVFNMPEGDSVFVTPGRTWSLYDYKRDAIPTATKQLIDQGKYPLIARPMDKIDHYVKHCIATPGDTMQIIDRQVYINGVKAENPKHLQFRYLVKHPTPLNEKKFADWGISQEDQQYYNSKGANYKMLVLSNQQKELIQGMDSGIEIIPNDMYWVNFPNDFTLSQLKDIGVDNGNIRTSSGSNRLLLTLSKEQVTTIQALNEAITVEAYEESDRLFPHDPANFKGWSADNYGPIWVPKAGATIKITPNNIAPYRRIIDIYEDNDLEIKNGRIYINGTQTTQYTFQQNYYWMMGDNRNNSEDSRTWGYVPETHILGKPLFIFFSTKLNDMAEGIYWDRIFTSASKAGVD